MADVTKSGESGKADTSLSANTSGIPQEPSTKPPISPGVQKMMPKAPRDFESPTTTSTSPRGRGKSEGEGALPPSSPGDESKMRRGLKEKERDSTGRPNVGFGITAKPPSKESSSGSRKVARSQTEFALPKALSVIFLDAPLEGEEEDDEEDEKGETDEKSGTRILEGMSEVISLEGEDFGEGKKERQTLPHRSSAFQRHMRRVTMGGGQPPASSQSLHRRTSFHIERFLRSNDSKARDARNLILRSRRRATDGSDNPLDDGGSSSKLSEGGPSSSAASPSIGAFRIGPFIPVSSFVDRPSMPNMPIHTHTQSNFSKQGTSHRASASMGQTQNARSSVLTSLSFGVGGTGTSVGSPSMLSPTQTPCGTDGFRPFLPDGTSRASCPPLLLEIGGEPYTPVGPPQKECLLPETPQDGPKIWIQSLQEEDEDKEEYRKTPPPSSRRMFFYDEEESQSLASSPAETQTAASTAALNSEGATIVGSPETPQRGSTFRPCVFEGSPLQKRESIKDRKNRKPGGSGSGPFSPSHLSPLSAETGGGFPSGGVRTPGSSTTDLGREGGSRTSIAPSGSEKEKENTIGGVWKGALCPCRSILKKGGMRDAALAPRVGSHASVAASITLSVSEPPTTIGSPGRKKSSISGKAAVCCCGDIMQSPASKFDRRRRDAGGELKVRMEPEDGLTFVQVFEYPYGYEGVDSPQSRRSFSSISAAGASPSKNRSFLSPMSAGLTPDRTSSPGGSDASGEPETESLFGYCVVRSDAGSAGEEEDEEEDEDDPEDPDYQTLRANTYINALPLEFQQSMGFIGPDGGIPVSSGEGTILDASQQPNCMISLPSMPSTQGGLSTPGCPGLPIMGRNTPGGLGLAGSSPGSADSASSRRATLPCAPSVLLPISKKGVGMMLGGSGFGTQSGEETKRSASLGNDPSSKNAAAAAGGGGPLLPIAALSSSRRSSHTAISFSEQPDVKEISPQKARPMSANPTVGQSGGSPIDASPVLWVEGSGSVVQSRRGSRVTINLETESDADPASHSTGRSSQPSSASNGSRGLRKALRRESVEACGGGATSRNAGGGRTMPHSASAATGGTASEKLLGGFGGLPPTGSQTTAAAKGKGGG
eukprot:Cvel_16920.t1-p1 / transcript=Cvel_16920.t1 / gene=Cvel_16920 / organism=Chromera_velia_CCMP2878 / gene_product=hypothetical protein / transcript_product=hypothetical protein / location=Cvel_scaffold1325:45237-49556(+) / protein_length=1108 / sequence_SO=supercontig / SO=protein_coding / is_pseudo=false